MAAFSVPLPLSINSPLSQISISNHHSALLRQHWDSFRSVQTLRLARPAQSQTSIFAKQHGEDAPQSQSDGFRSASRWMWLGIAASFAVLLVVCVKKLSSLDALKTHASGSNFSFSANIFGRKFSLAERTPGWIYFSLLMAAGCGLFISEEALNVWVGATLARSLVWDSSRLAFMSSFGENMSFIVSTVLWVYWGVCISDLVPFYAGRLAARSGSGTNFCTKLGINKEKLDTLSKTVQRYGNLIGFVERFSIGARNPTAFLAGASGIEPSKFFVGVCLGGLLTLPLQLSVGVVLRERPAAALAGVAAFVGIWTVFPYLVAAALSVFYFTNKQKR